MICLTKSVTQIAIHVLAQATPLLNRKILSRLVVQNFLQGWLRHLLHHCQVITFMSSLQCSICLQLEQILGGIYLIIIFFMEP